MLTVEQLSRSYGHFKAVDAVGFSVERGEIVGLLGHNGAGKTTIMKMITGYLEPDQGSVTMNGISIADDPITIQQELGYLPENLPIYGEMVIADYLDYVAELKQLGDNKNAEIKRVIEATDIGDKLLSPISTLSRGYKQRVGVAQALLGDPKLLILDEPTNGLDPTQTEHMRNLIKNIAQHATVILSTHIMQEVEAICNRVLIVNSGQLVVDEKLEKLRQSNHLRVETSLNRTQLEDIIATNSEVAGLRIEEQQVIKETDDLGESYQYKISLQNSQQRQVAAALANAILQKEGILYQLQIERRDLESLFKEVSGQNVQSATNSEEKQHAER